SAGIKSDKYINFLSASRFSSVDPYQVAGGMSGFFGYVFKGTNVLTSDWLSPNMQNRRRVGIIAADFPGPELIDRIIKQNTMYTTDITFRRGEFPGGTGCLYRTWGNVVLASNGWQELVWQSDGNLVVYDGKGPRWATGTNSPTVTNLCWQNDGNLV